MSLTSTPTPPPQRPIWPWTLAVAVLAVLIVVSLARPTTTTAAPVAPVAAAPVLAPTTQAAYAPFGYTVVPNFVGSTGDETSTASSAADLRNIQYARNYAAMSSRAISQYPPAGTNWNKTDPVQITLDPATASDVTTTTGPTPSSYNPPPAMWTYKITGKSRGSITYSSDGGNTAQVTDARLPWTKKVGSPSFGGMSFAYVSAQNSGGGSISCQIVDPTGALVAENSSEGDYAIVTCQG